MRSCFPSIPFWSLGSCLSGIALGSLWSCFPSIALGTLGSCQCFQLFFCKVFICKGVPFIPFGTLCACCPLWTCRSCQGFQLFRRKVVVSKWIALVPFWTCLPHGTLTAGIALVTFWTLRTCGTCFPLWTHGTHRTLWTHSIICFLCRFLCRFDGCVCVCLPLQLRFLPCLLVFLSDGFVQNPLIFCCHSVCLAVNDLGNRPFQLFQLAQISRVVPRRVNGGFYKDRCLYTCPPYRPSVIKGSHVNEYSPRFREVLFCHIPKQCDGFILNTLYQQRRIFCAALILQIQPECQRRKVDPVRFVPLHDKLSADGFIIPDDKSLFLIWKDHLFSNNRDHNITPFL